MTPAENEAHGLAGRIAEAFVNSKLTPLLVIVSVLLGLFAVIALPREEEPQIKVPMIDVMVSMPGANAKEIEERATRPMEHLLWEIPGVEYIYSTSRPGESLIIVRFLVGSDLEKSLVLLNEKLRANFDRIPPGVGMPLVKPRSIDDVPILALTFHSKTHDHPARCRDRAHRWQQAPAPRSTRSRPTRFPQSQPRWNHSNDPAIEPPICLGRTRFRRQGNRRRDRRISRNRRGCGKHRRGGEQRETGLSP